MAEAHVDWIKARTECDVSEVFDRLRERGW